MILAKAKIGDYDRFTAVFTDRGLDQRRRFGSHGAKVFRNQQDPNEVWVLFDWATDDFEQFLKDPQSQEILADAGLEGPPDKIPVEAGPETEA